MTITTTVTHAPARTNASCLSEDLDLKVVDKLDKLRSGLRRRLSCSSGSITGPEKQQEVVSSLSSSCECEHLQDLALHDLPQADDSNTTTTDAIATPAEGKADRAWYDYHTAAETPAWLLNPFLVEGYRVELSYTECFKSIFTWHNETANIWTAAISAVILVVQLALYLHYERITGGLVSEIVFSLSMLLAVASSVLSAVFHTFLSRSLPTKRFCASLDYFGLFLIGYGTAIPGVWYGLSCHPFVQNCYLFVIASIITLGLPFSFNEYVRTNRVIRTSGFAALSIFGVVFALHTGYLVGWNSELFLWHIFKPIGSFFVFMGVALFFYISRIPERCCPGKFDVYCPSHAIWHVVSSSTIMFVFYQWTELSLYHASSMTCSV